MGSLNFIPRTMKNSAKQAGRYVASILCAAAMLVAVAAMPAFAGSVSGTVTDGTTNKVVAGATVILLQLEGGMEPVATTKTDAAGHYSIDNSAIGGAPMLLRVPYRGVLYHQPVPPGPSTAKADIEVYEPTTDPHAFSVASYAIVLQPKGSNLVVGEEYTIENQTSPPVAYYLKDGTFRFKLPAGAQLDQVSASGPTGMPVVQGTIDKGGNLKAIDWPFRPGENGVRISYEIPYPGNSTTLNESAAYTAQQVILAVPPGLQVSSPGFTPAGTQQGYQIYSHDQIAANTPVTIQVSGTATAAPASDQDSGSQNPSAGASTDTSTAESTVTLPARLDGIRYILVAGFAVLFGLGVVLLWRRPAVASAPGGVAAAPVATAKPAAPVPTTQARSRPAKAKAADSPPVEQGVAQVEQEVNLSLEGIKDALFRLELRRQAGTVGDAEYSRERQRMETQLRDFLKG